MKIREWTYDYYDSTGLVEFVAWPVDNDSDDAEVIHTGRQWMEAGCKELWSWIKEEYPHVDNYSDFCYAYRRAKEGHYTI